MQPTDTRDEIEENTHSVPFRLQRDILICQHLVAVQEGEAIGVIGITLVSIRLPEERGRHMSEECSRLQRVGQLAAHAELCMLGEEYAQVGVERILRIGDWRLVIADSCPMAGFEAEEQDRVFGRISIAAQEETIVFAFSP